MSLVTGVLVYALLSYSITSNMLIPLLPELEHSYGISPVTAIWVTLVALLAGAACVPTLCRLGDTLGWKKSMTIVGLGCLLAGGVIAASFGLIYVEDIPPEHVGRLFGISPILAQGIGGSLAGAIFGAFLTANHLPGSQLPSKAAFTGFWFVAAGACLLATALASIYLVTFWAGLRGGDRAMVRPEPATTGAERATVGPAT
jgi:MFS family permease